MIAVGCNWKNKKKKKKKVKTLKLQMYISRMGLSRSFPPLSGGGYQEILGLGLDIVFL